MENNATPAANTAPAVQSSGNHYPIVSLYVGDLDPDVTEANLFDKFCTVGPVLSIRVCRDIITRRSLGYAYVNYQNSNDAETAIDTLNFERLNGRPIRIMWSQRDPSLRRSGVGNIFIKNLDKSVDNKVLFDTFSMFGNILSCKISYDEKGQTKGYGFVHFDSEDTAQAAIRGLNGKYVKGRKVYVGKFISRSERENKWGPTRRFNNVYVKNLTDDYDTDEKLKALFDLHGTITSAVVAKDEDGKSKGFGFVCYSTPDQAEQAVSALNGKDMGNGKTLYVGRAQKKAEREAQLKRKLELLKIERINRSQGVNLYVKNLEDSINDERLQKEFSAYGTITSAKVMTDEKGRSKGFGFVCFSTPEEATRAVTEMNNRIIESKPLYVALAQRKEDRAAQKMNRLRFASGVRFSHQLPQNAHHSIGAPQIPFANQALAGFAGIQGQAVQGPQSQPYLLPIAPNTMQRSYFPPNAPAAMAPGGQGPTGPIRLPRWNTNAPMPRGQMPINYNQQGFRNMQPRSQHQNLSRPGGPGGAGPNPRAPFVGQNIAGVNGAVNLRGQGRPGAANVPPGVRGQEVPNKPAVVSVVSPQELAHPGQPAGHFPLNTFSEQSSEEQSQILGERLFPLVSQLASHQSASKITGMLLEMDVQEILHMLENPDSLKSKVEEALAVLKAHRAKEMHKKTD